MPNSCVGNKLHSQWKQDKEDSPVVILQWTPSKKTAQRAPRVQQKRRPWEAQGLRENSKITAEGDMAHSQTFPLGIAKKWVTQLCLILCNPMDYSLPSSSVHGILQARILKWVAIPFSRRSLQLRDRTHRLPRNLLKCPMRGFTNFLPTLLKVLMLDGNHTTQQILFLILLPLSYPLL